MAPSYAGMSGKPLSLTVSTIATMGFLLFGYDREYTLTSDTNSTLLTVYRGCHVRHY